jgi:pimeloyl-ACP methyl ester carboxylesterase
MPSRTYTLSTPYGEVPVTFTERGSGTPVLLLHGGAGPDSVVGFADQFPEFHVLPNAGHLPQVETPEAVLAVREVLGTRPDRGAVARPEIDSAEDWTAPSRSNFQR